MLTRIAFGRREQDSCGLENPEPISPGGAGSQQTAVRRPSTTSASSRTAPPNTELEYLRRKVAELEDVVRRDASADVRLHPPSPADEVAAAVQGVPVDPSLQCVHAVSASGDRVDTADPVMKDAASILEFLAWGRRKDPDYHSVVSPDATFTVAKASGDVGDSSGREMTSDTFDECSQLGVIQLLLPNPRQVWQLVDYHEECLLWYHGSYFAPTFRAQLETFYTRHNGTIDSPGVNLQWVALLFSIMTASLACAPPTRVQSWGFRGPERETLSKRWFQAVITCLNRAGYTANLSIFSCQAIATNTIAAHLLGFSNSQSIHLAAAVRVAQSLALHRLGRDATGSIVEKEIGRRVWCQLCSQDWFGIPFSESYLVNPVYSTSDPPANCHDHDLVPLPFHVPTRTSYCRFLREVAAIMPQLQDGLMACNTAYTRYEQVLAWDARLRTLATSERPLFLSSAPIEPDWPAWTPWARRALAISSSHKIIMIHRSFLSDSFSNPAFAFTRRTCLAASKTIIKEYKCVVEEDGPILWIHQAFSVAASIILLLDVLHRDPSEREWSEHRQLAEDVVGILSFCRNSMIAARGIKLLGALLGEVNKAGSGEAATTALGRKRRRDDSVFSQEGAASAAKKGNKFDVPHFVKSFCEDKSATQAGRQGRANAAAGSRGSPPRTPSSEDPPTTYNEDDMHHHELMDFAQSDFNFSFPPAGLDGANGFENLLYLANHDCFSIF